jgi:hypothetical protein
MYLDLEVWLFNAEKVFLSSFEASHTPANDHILLCVHVEMCSFARVGNVSKLNF